MKTMIMVVLDRSGSMSGRETDVIGGVNSFVAEQQKLPDPASIALVRFDSGNIERFRAMAPIAEFIPLTSQDFEPRGGTPLLDAIGQTIVAMDTDWKNEQPDRAIMVIVTDGAENASKEYSHAAIKQMIDARQNSGLWSFIYLAANVDAFETGAQMGFMARNSAGFTNTAKGTRAAYGAMSETVRSMRATGATVADNLGRNIGEDEQPKEATISIPIPKVVPVILPKDMSTWSPPTAPAAVQQSQTWTPPQ